MKVTITDIANDVGVSISTVSRTLNYDETLNIGEETRKKIFEVAEKLKYESPVRKKRKKKYNIGVYCSYSYEEELIDTYYLSIRIAIENKLKEEKVNIQRIESIDEFKNIKNIDGIIALGTFDELDIANMELCEKPIIFVDHKSDDEKFDCVVIDFEKATKKAMEYLFELGHNKIAFIGGCDYDYKGNKMQDYREINYTRFMKEKKIYNEAYIKMGKYDANYGFVSTKELIKSGNLPTAIIVANDSIAIGCYKAILEEGLSIPNDISIIGFNDISTSEYMFPPLTTIRLHSEFMGITAVETLLERLITERELSKTVIIPTKLITRESCTKISQE
ncbi:LacI family DNA-binding transcriptional regulator [Romboutsia sp.]|uniref:LacI family DNA-binding transcriptional regulator n=1 Tax=Romboutsia sp. TaxID=1965302 RepID=UPI003F3BDBB5